MVPYNWSRTSIFAIATIWLASCAHAAAAPDAEFEEQAWSWLSGRLGASSADEMSALRANFPEVHPVDIHWIHGLMLFDEQFLATPGNTADALLSSLDNQLLRTLAADPAATAMAQILYPARAADMTVQQGPARDAALWDHLHAQELLHGFEYGRDDLRDIGVSAVTLIWVYHARLLDTEAMKLLHVTAHDLVGMAGYQLARKLQVDAYVAGLIGCIRCSDAAASYYVPDCDNPRAEVCQRTYEVSILACNVAAAACRLNPFGRGAACARLKSQC